MVLVRSLVRFVRLSAWVISASFRCSAFSSILYTSIVSVVRIINHGLDRNKQRFCNRITIRTGRNAFKGVIEYRFRYDLVQVRRQFA